MLSMEAAAVLAKLEALGVALSVEGDRLQFEAPAGVLFDVNELKAHKAELLPLIRDRHPPPIFEEMPGIEFDEDLNLWTRDGFIVPTRGTMPAYRKYWKARGLRRQREKEELCKIAA
jgi:hypothetical protein